MGTLTELIPPAVIIAVIIWTNNLTNKRISDLHNQLLQLGSKIDEHIANYAIHNKVSKKQANQQTSDSLRDVATPSPGKPA